MKIILRFLILALFAAGLTAASAQIFAATVAEFYNTNLDNYFITADANEAAAIDNGSAGPGWIRTGYSFSSGGTTSVCRFYGSQSPGPNSHFYTADTGECASLTNLWAATPATEKRWKFESMDFLTTLPTATGVNGTCPTGTAPVYRAYNNGFARGVDSNHRITCSQAAIQEVVTRGWNNEGVVMCAADATCPAPTTNPTSSELIDAATATGTITAENALIYKLYADFGDPLLPAQFKGDDTGRFEGHAQDEVLAYIASTGINNISPATLDTLQRYFVPAYYEGSWWHQQHPNATKSSVATVDVNNLSKALKLSTASDPNCRAWRNMEPCSKLSDWKFIEGSKVVVWYLRENEPIDYPKAQMLVQEFDNTVWPKLTNLMGRTPVSDAGTGFIPETDGRLDVMLVDLANNVKGWTIESSNISEYCKNAVPVHIYLDRKLDDREMKAGAAHEFMHAIQRSYSKASCDNYFTTVEATANWAIHFVYPSNKFEEHHAAHYLNRTNESYDHHFKPDDLFRYGAYVLPLFLETRYGSSIVKKIWDATTTKTNELDAIDAAIKAADSTSSFEKEWPKFIAANWNRETINTYRTNIEGRTLNEKADLISANDSTFILGSGIGTLKHAVSLPHASGDYYRVVFNNSNARTVLIVNGLSFHADSLDIVAAGKGKSMVFTGSDLLERRGASMQVFVKVNGAWLSGPTNLTNVPWYNLCRDDPAGKIDEMIFMYGNGEIDPSAPNYIELKPLTKEPGVLATNVGCRDWAGSLSMSRPLPGGSEKLKIDGIILKNALPTAAPKPGNGPPDYPIAPGKQIMSPGQWVYALTSGTATWDYTSYSDGCSYSGGMSFPISNATMPAYGIYGYSPPGDMDHAASIPGFLINALPTVMNLSYGSSCGGSNKGSGLGSNLDISVTPFDQSVRIDPGGLSISGTGKQAHGSGITGTWSLQGATQ